MTLSPKWLFAAVGLLSPSFFFAAAQTSSESKTGWYNGDRRIGIPGYANWYGSSTSYARIHDDFVVPPGGWTVTGVFSNNTLNNTPTVTQANWEIRFGVSEGAPGTLVASGTAAATQTYQSATGDYRIQVDGLSVQLAPGRYWLSVAPIGPTGGQSYLSATLGANAVGDPPGNNGGALNASFQPLRSSGQGGVSSDFSQGVLIGGPAPDAVTPLSIADQWKANVADLTKQMLLLYGLPFPGISKEDWLAKADALSRDIPTLPEASIRAGLAALVASIGDPHTDVGWPGTTPFRVLPLSFYWFDDGIYVTAASQDQLAVLGTKLVSVGATSADDAFRTLGALVPHENDQWLKQQIPRAQLNNADFLFATGLIPTLATAPLTVQTAAGDNVQVEIPSVLRAASPRVWPIITSTTPLYRQHTDRNYWATIIDNGATLYFQYNSCYEDAKQPAAEFFDQLKTMMDDPGVQRVVVDMRFNGGGMGSILYAWLNGIRTSRFNQAGRLYVIVGRATFSAAMEATDRLHDETAAIFVGEPTGAKPRFQFRRGDFLLPYFGVRVSYSSGNEPAKLDGPTLIPDIQTGLTFADYMRGADPALDAILALGPLPW